MPTPKAGYYLKDGSRVPGTTTIIGRFKPAEGLIHWAWQCGVDGKDYRKERDSAAGIGTLAHEMVERYLSGIPETECRQTPSNLTIEETEQAIAAFAAYLAWSKNFKVRVTVREVQLVSEKFRYGGTPDAIGVIDEKLVLIDYKTSNAVYGDYLFQLAAYGLLWEENFPDQPITGGYHLCRFAKTKGDFSHHYYSSLEQEKHGFLLMRKLYDSFAAVKKRAA